MLSGLQRVQDIRPRSLSRNHPASSCRPLQHHHLTRLQLSAIERHFYRRQHKVGSAICQLLLAQRVFVVGPAVCSASSMYAFLLPIPLCRIAWSKARAALPALTVLQLL